MTPLGRKLNPDESVDLLAERVQWSAKGLSFD